MPEGPEVHTIADYLNQEILGLTLIDVDYNMSSRYNKSGLLGHDALKALLPLKIVDVAAKGKKIIFMLENEQPIFLLSSLMMEGKWSWEEGKHSNLWFDLTSDGIQRRLYFDDSRHFGTLEIIFGEDDFVERISEIGPDLITDDISSETWLSQIRYSRIKNKKIGVFLTEQKYFSGIGNYLRAEILYEAKISPHRKLCQLSDDEARLVFTQARTLIKKAYEEKGATLATYRSPHGGKGGFSVKIYNHTIDPEGNPIIAEELDKRTIYWVPNIQT